MRPRSARQASAARARAGAAACWSPPAGAPAPPAPRALAARARGAAPAASLRRRAAGDNPYLGLLGAADAVIVTADSASMCTEACATGRPVFLFRPAAGGSAKLARLHAALEAAGYLRPLGAPGPSAARRRSTRPRPWPTAIRARLPGPIGAAAPPAVAPAPRLLKSTQPTRRKGRAMATRHCKAADHRVRARPATPRRSMRRAPICSRS